MSATGMPNIAAIAEKFAPEVVYLYVCDLEAENVRLKAALEPFTQWDFHATQWVAGVLHDGHELRAIHAEDVEKLMKQVEDAKRTLVSGSEGDTA